MMLDFDKELERFKPMIKVSQIEEQIASDPLEDMIDLFKSFKQDIDQEKYNMRKEG